MQEILTGTAAKIMPGPSEERRCRMTSDARYRFVIDIASLRE